MKKTALFFNGDYHLQRPISFDDVCNMSWNRIADVFYGKYRFYRQNLGTFLFTDTLARTLDAEWVNDYFWHDVAEKDFPKSIVTTLFHSITQFAAISDSLWDVLRKTDMKLILLSCGVNTGYFRDIELGSEVRNFLFETSQRNPIACRGEATADALLKYGIKNTLLVGCPSLYYHLKRGFKVEKKKLSAVSRASGCFHHYHDDVFRYFQRLAARGDVSLTIPVQQDFFPSMFGRPSCPSWGSFSYFDVRKNEQRIDFLKKYGIFHFSVDDWMNTIAVNGCEFSMGTTFHGNVAAVLAGVPALFLTVDTRMEELCRHHKLPSLPLHEFDPQKPLEYYYELADYAEFNRKYPENFDAYMEFCDKSDVAIVRAADS